MIVVFDLDGTLIDSARDIANSASELVVSLGGRPLDLDSVTAMIGDGAAVLVQRALREGGLDPNTPGALARFLDIYDRHLLDTTAPYPGMWETLTTISGRATLAVLTNKPLAHSERVLEGLGLRRFFEEVIGGDGAFRKPDPAGLLALMKHPAARNLALFVGDSPIDFRTATAAGCRFAWAKYGFGASRFDGKLPDTPYVLHQANELVSVVKQLAC